MIISEHARMRMQERCGFDRKTGDQMAKNAFEQGITHGQTKGRLNHWISWLYLKKKRANNIRIYEDNAYIFCGETLVTVIPVPEDVKEYMDRMDWSSNQET